MSVNNLNEARVTKNDSNEVRSGADDNSENGMDDTSEKAPLLPDIQTLKITSPKIDRTKQSNAFNKFLQSCDTDNADETSEPSQSTSTNTVADGNFAQSSSGTERPRSYTEPSRPLRWRLIGPYQDLRISRCKRLYAKSGRKDDLALFFQNGRFYAMEAWCSHMGGPLFDGEIEDYNGRCHVMCPWHSYMFDLATGKNEIGLQQNVPDLKYEDGMIYVKYHTDVSVMPCRKPSDKTIEVPQQVLSSARKISQPTAKGSGRKESVLESVMRLSPVQDGHK